MVRPALRTSAVAIDRALINAESWSSSIFPITWRVSLELVRPRSLQYCIQYELTPTRRPRRGPLLPPARQRDRPLQRLPRAATARHAQGADGLRQDALRRAHGAPPRPAAHHGRLPRRPLGE